MSVINPRPGPKSGPARPDSPLRYASQGASAALCAVAAMAAVSALALWLLDAGQVGSMWSLTMALTALAVGGSVNAGSDTAGATTGSGIGDLLGGLFGGGGMAPSMSGAADVAPLGVTLAGALMLWGVFSRQLHQRRCDTRELAARAGGAAAAALVAVLVVASLAHGTFSMPASAMSGLRDGQRVGSGGFAGGEGDLMGGLFGGGGTPQDMTMAYEVHAGAAGVGAVLWAAVVLAVGCLISRKVRMPLGGTVDRLRPAWVPGIAAIIRTLLVVAAVPLVLVTLLGAVVGGRAATAAGAALLLVPNAVAVFLTLGVGSPWTASTEQVQSEGGNPFAALMGQMGGQQASTPPDRTAHLRDLAAGGWPLWLGALTVTALLLLGCAYRAAKATDPARTPPLHRYRGPFGPHLGFAERFAVGTALIMGAAAWLAGASGHFGITMFGSEMGGTRAELTGNVLVTVVFGLLVGGVAGLAGCSLRGVVDRRSRLFVRRKAPQETTTVSGMEVSVGNR
ncbi:streptophobe family protein [Streptomyces sp. T028]|uniref:streptophobe family protein n=1 Tax=Streptomyces sp. T028 TaxID=3394379 RepID=UPI003A8ADF3E